MEIVKMNKMDKARLYYTDFDSSIETMTFEWNKALNGFKRGIHSFQIMPDGSIEFNIKYTSDFVPKFIEHITLEDCPDCLGTGKTPKYFDIYNERTTHSEMKDCEKCTDGKIEMVTSFTVFGKSKKEHDEAIENELLEKVWQIWRHTLGNADFTKAILEILPKEYNTSAIDSKLKELKSTLEELSKQESE